MPLPKIATPTYELELPSTGKQIKFRPFLVKEEKLLVLALESEDTKQILLQTYHEYSRTNIQYQK